MIQTNVIVCQSCEDTEYFEDYTNNSRISWTDLCVIKIEKDTQLSMTNDQANVVVNWRLFRKIDFVNWIGYEWMKTSFENYLSNSKISWTNRLCNQDRAGYSIVKD